MPNITVMTLKADSPELPAAAELFNQYRCFYGQPANLSLATRFLRERLQAGESVVLLAQQQGQWAGFCQLYRSFSSVACARTIILNDVYVAQSCRSAGVGRSLVSSAVALARLEGAACVCLETAASNTRAQALYESLGFERASGFLSYALSLHSPGGLE